MRLNACRTAESDWLAAALALAILCVPSRHVKNLMLRSCAWIAEAATLYPKGANVDRVARVEAVSVADGDLNFWGLKPSQRRGELHAGARQ